MAELSIIGEITEISDQTVISEKFTKQEFILNTGGQYPDLIRFELGNKTLDLINNFEVGDKVEVKFNIRGREHKGTVYNSLNPWKIVKA